MMHAVASVQVRVCRNLVFIVRDGAWRTFGGIRLNSHVRSPSN